MEYIPFHFLDIEPVRVLSVDTDVDELIPAGVHIV